MFVFIFEITKFIKFLLQFPNDFSRTHTYFLFSAVDCYKYL